MKACRVFIIAALLALATPALGQEALWNNVKAKMTSDGGYTLTCSYDGDEGAYRFRYVLWGGGEKILTEILEGSSRGAGSKILYDPAVDKDNVTVKTSFLTLRRSLGSKDIQGSSLYQPLFEQLVEELVEPTPRETLKVGGGTVFVFGDKAKTEHRLEVDASGSPLSFRHLEKGREIKKMTFRDLKWGKFEMAWP